MAFAALRRALWIAVVLLLSLRPLKASPGTAPKPELFKCEPGEVGSKTFDANGRSVELLISGPGCPDADPVLPAPPPVVPAGVSEAADQEQVVSDSPHLHAHVASASALGASAEVSPSSPGKIWLVIGSVLLIMGLVSGLAARLYDTKVRQPRLRAAAEKAQREKEDEERMLLEEGQRLQEEEAAEQERLRAQEEADRLAREEAEREARERTEREAREAREREEAELEAREREEREREAREREAREREERERLEKELAEQRAREGAARLERERREAKEREDKARAEAEAKAKAEAEAQAQAQKRCAPCCGSKPAATPGPAGSRPRR